MRAAVTVDGLRKSYGDVAAVRDVSFTVAPGEIFALLGPNGAGKSTTLEILEGFRRRDAGSVDVLGIDPDDPSRGRELREGSAWRTWPGTSGARSGCSPAGRNAASTWRWA